MKLFLKSELTPTIFEILFLETYRELLALGLVAAAVFKLDVQIQGNVGTVGFRTVFVGTLCRKEKHEFVVVKFKCTLNSFSICAAVLRFFFFMDLLLASNSAPFFSKLLMFS